jgi:hypothetical protein
MWIWFSITGYHAVLFCLISRRKLYLPSEEELRAEIEREREMVVREQGDRYGAGENS